MGFGKKIQTGVDLISFGKRIRSDKEFAEQFLGITDPDQFIEIAHANGYKFTMDDIRFGGQMNDKEIISLINYNTLIDGVVKAIDEDALSVETIEEGGNIIFILSGRLGAKAHKQFEKVLIPAFDDADSITLDLKDLVYLSSMGLRVLLLGQKTANLKGVPMTIRNVSEEIMEILTLTGFADILNIEP